MRNITPTATNTHFAAMLDKIIAIVLFYYGSFGSVVKTLGATSTNPNNAISNPIACGAIVDRSSDFSTFVASRTNIGIP